MLTPEQKENILTIMANKRQDIEYRKWARLVRSRVRELTLDDDEALPNQIRMTRIRLKDLEDIYTQRITKVTFKGLGHMFSCHQNTIFKLEKERLTGVSEYLRRKLVGSRL